MMPGVVAGFPRAPESATYTLMAAVDGSRYGYIQEGPDIPALGSISPAGATVIPGALATPGAAGEILQLSWVIPTGKVELIFIGLYASVAEIPFAEMIIDGLAFDRTSIDYLQTIPYFNATKVEWPGSGNPFSVGPHLVVFE